MDHADAGVIQGRSCAGLALKSLHRFLVAPQILGQKLQGHTTSQPGIFSHVNHTHAALPKWRQDAVMSNCLADLQDRSPLRRILLGCRKWVNTLDLVTLWPPKRNRCRT